MKIVECQSRTCVYEACGCRASYLVGHLGAVLVERLVRHSAAETHRGNSPGLGAGHPAVARLQQVLGHLQERVLRDTGGFVRSAHYCWTASSAHVPPVKTTTTTTISYMAGPSSSNGGGGGYRSHRKCTRSDNRAKS